MQIAERMAGYHWTADGIFVVQAVWLFVRRGPRGSAGVMASLQVLSTSSPSVFIAMLAI